MSKKQGKNQPLQKQTKSTRPPAASTFDWNRIQMILQAAVIIIGFFIVYNYISDKKVSVNGDNAYYYLLGKSIHEGKGYTYAFDQSHRAVDTYPPGYPFLLSILMFISKDITVLSMFSGALLLVSLLLLVRLFKQMEIPWQLSLVTALLVLCNYHVAGYAITTLSEVPYLLFTLLTLLVLTKLDTSASLLRDWRFYAMILLLVFTYYIRSTGLALMAGIVFYLITQRRWKESIVTATIFIALGSIWIIRGKVLEIPSAYREAVVKINPYQPEKGNVNFDSMVVRVGDNLNRYVSKEIPSSMVPSILVNYKEPAGSGSWMLGFFFIALTLYGWWRLPRYKWLVAGYFIATFGILMLWPKQWFGTRFMMSLIPFMTMLVLYALYDLLTILLKNINKSWAFPGLLFLPLILLYLKPLQEAPADNQNWQSYPLNRLHYTGILDYQPNWKNYFALAKWAKENTSKEAVIACRKPELFHLYADRYTCYFPFEKDLDKFIDGLKKEKVTHVVVDQLGFRQTGDYLVTALNARPHHFKVLQQLADPDSWLLEFIPDAVAPVVPVPGK